MNASGYPVAFEASAEDLERRALTCRMYERRPYPKLPTTNFDDTVLLRKWVQSILYIALSDHSQMSDDVDRGGPEHVIVCVGQGL